SSSRVRASEKRKVNERVTWAPIGLVARRANGDPAFQDQDLPIGEVGSALRHADADDVGVSFNFVNEVAVLGVARDDADGAGLASAGYIDDLVVSPVVSQVHASRRCAADVRMADDAGPTPGRICRLENLSLNARKRRLEAWCGPCELRELFIARRRCQA